MITYVPAGTFPTVKLEAVNVPEAVTVHAGAVATTAGVIVHAPASAVEKPLPESVTTIPTRPDVGLSEIVGPKTVNVA